MKKFWHDDEGALLATEWVFVVTLLVIGLVAGLKAVQQAVLSELEDVANAIGSLSQSYSVGGTHGCCASTNGSRFADQTNTFPVHACTESLDERGPSCHD